MANSFFASPSGVSILGLYDVSNNTGNRGQQFRSYPVPNLQLATYSLQIRDSNNGIYSTYIFPLSPENLRKEFDALANFYDVQGDASNNGVQRVFDIYGNTPVTFVIEGTTGWNLHSTDNYQYTGLQSIQRLEATLNTFAYLNQVQITNGNQNLYQLWFIDYFRNDYWQVVPVGKQGIRQSITRPTLVNYSFTLVGVRQITGAGVSLADPLATQLGQSSSTASNNLQSFNTDLSDTYTESTPVAT